MSEHGIPDGVTERLVHETGVGASQTRRRRQRLYDENIPREIELQYQVPITGSAGGEPIFVTVELKFDYAFHYDPGKRQSNLEEPHFTYGSHTNPPVGVFATVQEWLRDETNGSVIGAVVAIAAIGASEYNGLVHLTFQGLATFAEDDLDTFATSG